MFTVHIGANNALLLPAILDKQFQDVVVIVVQVFSYGEVVLISPTNPLKAVQRFLLQSVHNQPSHSETFHHQFSSQNNFIALVVHDVSPPVCQAVALLHHEACFDHETIHCPITHCVFKEQYFIMYNALIYIL
ncbi:hypothetical protein IJD44_05965 [bacterium]|nr:hypothetical protein [bacterium]